MKTVLEVIQSTTGYFARHAVDSPRLNIEHLLAHVVGKKRMDLYLEFDRPLADHELERLRDLVKRRASGEPLQHLLGTAEFHGRVFGCDKRALIPRPETEQFVELILAEKPAPQRALDVGTGSGVIALTLAMEWTETRVEAVDVAAEALALTQENAARLGLADRVKIFRSDLLAEAQGEFGLIAANLPYIASATISGLAREVQFDPKGALDGGSGGLDLIERLIAEAPRHLRGRLALEIGSEQSDAVRSAFTAYNYQDIRVVTDYQGLNRFAFATYG